MSSEENKQRECRKKKGKEEMTNKTKQKIDNAITNQINHVASHFRKKKNGGWPLEYAHIKNLVLEEFLGSQTYAYALNTLFIKLDRDFKVEYVDDKITIRRKNARRSRKSTKRS
jgi:hypothetical protein